MRTSSGLGGRRVGVTADRRWRAQADLLENLGAEVIHGPTIRTVDLSEPYVYFGVRLTSDEQGYVDPLSLLPPRLRVPAGAVHEPSVFSVR